MVRDGVSLSSVGEIYDFTITPLDRIIAASYQPSVQVGAVIVSTCFITWGLVKRTGRSRIPWIAIGSIPLLALLIRNITADRHRASVNDRVSYNVAIADRVNYLLRDLPEMD